MLCTITTKAAPTFRDFRNADTTELDWLLIPNLSSLEVRMEVEAPSAKSHYPWCPHLEREVWVRQCLRQDSECDADGGAERVMIQVASDPPLQTAHGLAPTRSEIARKQLKTGPSAKTS
jgi:hypothetical protein